MTGQRPFERTHPWLTFRLDLRRLKHTDWLALGEAAAKCWHIAAAPLDPQVSDDVHQLYLAKGALATTAIEGNTLSEDEARAALAGSLKLPPSREYLKRELDNIIAACNELSVQLEQEGPITLTVERIERMNARVLNGLDVDEQVTPGRVRTGNVSVGRYRCPEGRDARFLVQRLCTTLNELAAQGIGATAFSIIKAIFAHVYFVWIHPFGDGNGRTGRLLELAILLEAGLPQPVCHLLSNHYNLTRASYYRELDRASRRPSGIYGFLAYALRGFVDGLDEQLGVIRQHQWQVAWGHFVHERFRTAHGATDRRRRSLALALATRTDAVALDELPNLAVDVARAYANLSRRTLVRDAQALVQLGLLRQDGNAFRVNRGLVLALLPWRYEGDVTRIGST